MFVFAAEQVGELVEDRLLEFVRRERVCRAGVAAVALPEQFLGVVGLEAAVLIPPPAVGVIADPERPDDVGNGLALGDQLLSLAELADDLLGRCFRAMGFLRVEDPHITWTDLRGSPSTSVRLIVGIRTPCRAFSSGMFLAL